MRARAILGLSLAGAALVGSIVPALAYWQYRWQEPPKSGKLMISPYFTTEGECQKSLKNKEKALENRYPNPENYPLIGSCEKSQ
jgi:hypothetical protein